MAHLLTTGLLFQAVQQGKARAALEPGSNHIRVTPLFCTVLRCNYSSSTQHHAGLLTSVLLMLECHPYTHPY